MYEAPALFSVEPVKSGMLNQLWHYQMQKGFISDEDIQVISNNWQLSKVETEGVVSFYHFFHRQPAGKFTIYVNNSITSVFKGFGRVLEAFEQETGASLGSVDRTGTFGLFTTPCIGLNDQEPAALINFQPFTHLNALKVRKIIDALKQGAFPEEICDDISDNIRYLPPASRTVFFRPFEMGDALLKMEASTPEDVINMLQHAELSGRGGAFFPTWRKWDACSKFSSDIKFIVCNADEGEPGTFKDRVLLQRQAPSLIEGMMMAGYAVGAAYGVIYLRGEYRWLEKQLQIWIDAYRERGFLGKPIDFLNGFAFDIRIQMGAGAYVCGEETALLESMEGSRGEPRTKWFFPVEKGYLNRPTVVNNVETFCAAARILEMGVAEWLKRGIPGSPGTKLISVSGDVERPGIYEIEWGMTINELLEHAGAENTRFIQFSGPSGETLSMDDKYQRISLLRFTGKDIRCGGSFMAFSKEREILDILINFANFFSSESCGICTPCRAGNFIVQRQLKRIQRGVALPADLDALRDWGAIMQKTSRCGLGKTAPNAVITSMTKFRDYFDAHLDADKKGLVRKFDIEEAVEAYEKYKN